MCTADNRAQWGRDRPEAQSPWSSVGHQSSVYPTHFLPHCRLQQPAEATWSKNPAWEGPRGEERVSVTTETCVKGDSIPCQAGQGEWPGGNSRHWAFWLAIDAPLEMLQVIGVPVSQIQGQGPPNFIMRLESIFGISRIISLYFQEAPSSGQRHCGKRIESAPLPGACRSAPKGQIGSCLVHQGLAELVLARHACLCLPTTRVTVGCAVEKGSEWVTKG